MDTEDYSLRDCKESDTTAWAQYMKWHALNAFTSLTNLISKKPYELSTITNQILRMRNLNHCECMLLAQYCRAIKYKPRH